jgi:uncharacterized protein with LGFP repeats
VIRRLFWLSLGAVLGVSGYRRAVALARSLSPVAQAGRMAGFLADVREGMAVYMERHPAGGRPTLEGHGERRHVRGQSVGRSRSRPDDDKDGR